jgi:hypothetical protein
MTLKSGTKAQISWDFNLKNLKEIKPGTRKVKTKAAKRAMQVEGNDAKASIKSRKQIQNLCRTD